MKTPIALFLFIAMLSGAGCVKKVTTVVSTAPPIAGQAQGGEDAGAGNSVASSNDEVRQAVNTLWQKAIDDRGYDHTGYGKSDFLEAVFKQVYDVKAIELNVTNADIERLRLVADKTFLQNEATAYRNDRRLFPNDYLIESDLWLKSKGSCSAKLNSHADASVSKFSYGARICLSMENLKKIPASALQLELLGLLVHEMAHISGFEERDAVLLQRAILVRASPYFNPQYGPLFFAREFKKVLALEAKFKRTAMAYAYSPKDDFILTQIRDLTDEITFTDSTGTTLNPNVIEPNSKGELKRLSDYYSALQTVLKEIPQIEKWEQKKGQFIVGKTSLAIIKKAAPMLDEGKVLFGKFVRMNFPQAEQDIVGNFGLQPAFHQDFWKDFHWHFDLNLKKLDRSETEGQKGEL